MIIVKRGDLKTCVQYNLFCIKYIEKNATFHTQYRFLKNFENMSNEGILNVPKIYVKCFIPLTKVNIHTCNDDYDHNILHQF